MLTKIMMLNADAVYVHSDFHSSSKSLQNLLLTVVPIL